MPAIRAPHCSIGIPTMNNYSRRFRLNINNNNNNTNSGGINTGFFTSRSRLPYKSHYYVKPKNVSSLVGNFDVTPLARSKRFKSRKIGGCQKIETIKKQKMPDYTENAYREAVSKLKYLLAESYAPRLLSGKMSRGFYRRSNLGMNETPEDSDDRSISDCSRAKGLSGNQLEGEDDRSTNKNRRLVAVSQHSEVSLPGRESSPAELTSFIARQEEYIEQLEQESRYCKDELKNLLGKIREVVAENEALNDRKKAGLFKSFLREGWDDETEKSSEQTRHGEGSINSGKRVKIQETLEGPSIVFESKISELEAQLTQTRIELKKAREANESARRSDRDAKPEVPAAELENVIRERNELAVKLEEALKNVQAARDRETDTLHKAKRATDLAQRSDFDKYHAETEIRRLNSELDRQQEKLRELAQETSRRVTEERHQVERRYSQQVEQLSADVASHWDAASKSQLETERQRRELMDLKRDLGQKQTMIEDLKKELQNKISNLQSDLNRSIAEKDAADEELAAAKLAVERSERHLRQEQSRWQAEINSYKQRSERADADLLHCRRENLRLSEQIASLEKELNMSKLINPPETPSATPRPDEDKNLATMIMDIENKHAATVSGLEDSLSNQAKLVSRLTAECQSLTHRLEANDRTHKEEMASLQSNLEYLTSKINDTLDNKQGGQGIFTNRNIAQHGEIINDGNNAQRSAPRDYERNNDGEFESGNVDYTAEGEIVSENRSTSDDRKNYSMQDDAEMKYEGQEYPLENYPTNYNDENYDQNYGQNYQQNYGAYEQDPNDNQQQQPISSQDYQQENNNPYENYSADNYIANSEIPTASEPDESQANYVQTSVAPPESKNSEA